MAPGGFSGIRAHLRAFAQAVDEEMTTFSWSSPRVRLALVAGLASAIAVWASLQLDLDQPMWSGMTALLVTQKSALATQLKGILRCIGTLVGAILGAFVVCFASDSHSMLCLALFAGVGWGLYRSYATAFPYAWLLGSITFGIIIFSTIVEPDSGLHIAAYRAAEILVGVVVSWAAAALFLPEVTDPRHPERDQAIFLPPPPPPPPHAASVRAAVSAAASLIVVLGLYALFDLPGLTGVGVSVTRIADPNPALGMHRGLLRLIGGSAGAAIGFVCIGLSIGTTTGLMLTIFVVMAVCAYFTSGPAGSAYAGLQAGITFQIAFVAGADPTATLAPPIDRIAGIVIALVVFWAVDVCVGAFGLPRSTG